MKSKKNNDNFHIIPFFNWVIMPRKDFNKIHTVMMEMDKIISRQDSHIKNLMRMALRPYQEGHFEVDFPNSRKGGKGETGTPTIFPDIF